MRARHQASQRVLGIDDLRRDHKDDRGNDYFFHQSAIYGEGIADLREGDSVEFEVGQGP